MVKFNEIPKAMGQGMEAVGRFTQEQLAFREIRLQDQDLVAKLEQTKTLLKGDIKNACAHGAEAVYRIALAGPLGVLWNGTKEFGSIAAHNFSTQDKKKKKSYFTVPAAMTTELLSQWGKGAISTAKLAGNLSVALGRASILGGRYIVGK